VAAAVLAGAYIGWTGLAGGSHAGAATTYTVDTAAADTPVPTLTACTPAPGDCSMRGAMANANAGPAGDTVNFDTTVFPPGTPIAVPASTLSGGGDTLDGAGAGVMTCVTIPSDNNTVKGMRLAGCTYGAHVTPSGSGNVIGPSNVIYNNVEGARIEGASNTVKGNLIGVSEGGSEVHPDGGNSTGVQVVVGGGNIIGGSSTADRNVISGNVVGVSSVEASSTTIAGNYIGTDASGEAAIGNEDAGIAIEGANHAIGGAVAGAGNVISGNGLEGIRILSGSGIAIKGNRIGTNAAASDLLGNAGSGIYISGGETSNITIGGTSAAERNVLSGNADGIVIDGGATSNLVRGNYVGTDATGTTALGNSNSGILVSQSPGNTIGGTGQGAGNLVSGNGTSGVFISGEGSTGNTVQGNFIGTDANGEFPLGGAIDAGVYVTGAASNTIGGTAAGARNVISGNEGFGIYLDSNSNGNSVQGNYIGTDATGSFDLGNTEGLVSLGGNTIGGSGAGAGNLISGNNDAGLRLGSGNVVQGNYIGTDATGTDFLPNGMGIEVDGAGNAIGGTTGGARNVISANGGPGVFVSLISTGTSLLGNLIGVDVTQTKPLGNGGPGVVLSSGAVVGGTAAGAGNTIAHNTDGISVMSGTGSALRRNSIYSNAGLGIDLAPTGITANDVGDGDTGANLRQNFPQLTSVSAGGGSTTVNGSLNSAAMTNYTIEFFHTYYCDTSGHGEGKGFLGEFTGTTDGAGNLAFVAVLPSQAPAGSFLSATATDPAGNTSEFSACAAAFDDADDDDDGYHDTAEASIGTSPRDPCGNDGWPADLNESLGPPSTFNRLSLADITSFTAPLRRLGTSPGDTFFDARWDLVPGSFFGEFINIQDITAVFGGDTGFPPMFASARAFDKTCPFPP
jgi:titin